VWLAQFKHLDQNHADAKCAEDQRPQEGEETKTTAENPQEGDECARSGDADHRAPGL
jgi:hypothetical protein